MQAMTEFYDLQLRAIARRVEALKALIRERPSGTILEVLGEYLSLEEKARIHYEEQKKTWKSISTKAGKRSRKGTPTTPTTPSTP